MVAQCGSVRKAAEKLHVAQSAISRQIIAYEQETGVKIFHRVPRGLQLTDAGRTVIAHVHDTLREYQRMRDRLEDLKRVGAGEVAIASAAGLVSSYLPSHIAAFSAKFPQARFSVNVLSAHEIVQSVASGTTDLGVGFDLPENASLEVLASIKCHLGVIFRPNHPLRRKRTIRISDCAGYPLILPDTSLTLRWFLDSAFAREPMNPRALATSNSIDLMKQLALNGTGITFLSALDAIDEIKAGTLVHRTLADLKNGFQSLKIVKRQGVEAERTVAMFAEVLKMGLKSAR